ncbi:hypothetical protein LPJ53_005181 [Coemansia erecta]|uniref:Peptidase S28 n=1 Tax=Coemansia erecta TaxID=147472 RepID=A0A9W8CP21_9FUNG|nr:hypothetical protein LPJ53_005181 [Coemansia erecta]
MALYQHLASLLLLIRLVASLAVDTSNATYWFAQPVDHFGNTSSGLAQWQQQYMINATYYQPGGPVFLITPGETPLTRYYADTTHLNTLAQSLHALVVAIEHRFYGDSNPTLDLSAASLQYLTIPNVLADFASFTRSVKQQPSKVFPGLAVPENSRVIFFGGSYAGNVAAWMRSEYPELIDGAWASSAVVYGRLQDYQYDQRFGAHLQSLGCGQCFAQAVSDLDQMLLSNDPQELLAAQQKFGIPELSASDTAALISALVSATANEPVSQMGDPMLPAVCAFFNTSSCIDGYAAATNAAIQMMGLLPQQLLIMGNSSLALDYDALGQVPRVWYYQMCSWFGGWQVPPPASMHLTPYRSQLLDLDYWQGNCQKKFGTGVAVPVDVEGYNRRWFDTLRGVSNIYYTAGELEIWRDSTVVVESSLLGDVASGSRIRLIEGANHGQDIQAESDLDLDTVKEARRVGDRLVRRWLNLRTSHGPRSCR